MRGMVAVLLVSVVSAACVHHAALPRIPTDADRSTREQIFRDHQLETRDDLWVRADGRYGVRTLSDVVSTYPESRAAFRRARTGWLVTAGLTIAGGTFAGAGSGGALFSEPGERDGFLTMAVVGATLFAFGLVLDEQWLRPAMRDVARSYNEGLRRELALPPPRRTDSERPLLVLGGDPF